MKLRIKDNSLRMRLSMAEVDQLSREGQVLASMTTPSGITFFYAVSLGIENDLEVLVETYKIEVIIPANRVRKWSHSQQVGMEASYSIKGQASFRVVVEKDFQCLTERRHEDESGLFPNPRQSH